MNDREFIDALRGVLRLEPLYPAARDVDGSLFTDEASGRRVRETRRMHWARDPWTMLDRAAPRSGTRNERSIPAGSART